jgi:hypothetical protein
MPRVIPRSLRVAAAAVLAIGLMTGCAASTTTVSFGTATNPPGAAASAGTAATAGPTGSPNDGQTDTAWGRIWDWVPEGFPTYAGATASDETDLGPASVVDVVGGAEPADVIGWYEKELQGAGYATDALNGPMEDGGYTLDMHGSPTGCQLEVAAAPMGSSTTVGIVVRYGAACPNS